MITPAYLDRFSCIEENCEDNCCHDWLIHIDKNHYHKIKEAMSVNAEKKFLFKANVQLTLKSKSSNVSYAHLVLDQKQQCGFLDTTGLCGLQSDYPQSLLPEGCRSYPRNYFFNGLGTEMYGSLSCPEIARLCLLSDDAMEPVSKEEPQQLNTRYNHHIPPKNHSFYQKYNLKIRATMVELLESSQYSLNQRLYLMVILSKMTTKNFHAHCDIDPGQSLQDQINHMNQSSTTDEIVSRLNKISLPDNIESLSIILKLLTSLTPKPFIVELFQRTFGIDISSQATINFSLSLTDVYTSYKKRAETIDALYGERITQYFTHFSINYWLADWYLESDDLITHCKKLLIQIACLRFLFFSHQKIFSLFQQKDISGKQDLLDTIAVDVFYQFARVFEHEKDINKKINDCFFEYTDELSTLTSLIKF